MGWLAFTMLVAVVLVTGFVVWRKWIAPWRDVDQLADDIVEHRAPRRFLISGNPHVRRVGLAFEKLAERRRELQERVREGEQSVQGVFGAMLDGLVVVGVLGRVRHVNGECRRAFGGDENGSGGTHLELLRHASVERLVMEAIRSRQPQRESWRLSRGPSDGREME